MAKMRERIRRLWQERWKKKARLWIKLILNWRFLVCFGIGWMITNGWSYVLLFVGFLASIDWMKAVSLGYLAILWIPFSPEKVVTVSIALFLVRRLFPKHNRELEAQIMEAVPPKSRKKPRRKKDSGEV
ncbi:MAG: hypothetical protein IJZ80_07155 [Clostridia bacterium]|nr:hypothetical protein [Clostridia bacterium]